MISSKRNHKADNRVHITFTGKKQASCEAAGPVEEEKNRKRPVKAGLFQEIFKPINNFYCLTAARPK